MGRQREQLETTSDYIHATRSAAEQAGVIMRSMYVIQVCCFILGPFCML